MTHLLSGFALVESGPALINAVSPVSNHKTQIKIRRRYYPVAHAILVSQVEPVT